MKYYRYILDKSSKKFICPSCNKKKFVRFIDIENNNEYMPDNFGRCDSGHYYLTPYQKGYKNSSTQIFEIKEKPIVNFDFNTFKETLSLDRYPLNVFINNLIRKIDDIKSVTEVVQLYRLGTIAKGYRSGAVTFPFIDKFNNVKAIQVKQFDESNHTTGTDFLHSMIEKYYLKNNLKVPDWIAKYKDQDKIINCLFGEHLLTKYPNNKIGLVEAPKTAIVCSLYFGLPKNESDIVFLAVYNKSSFSLDKVKALQGREVIVFPDLSENKDTYNEWRNKALNFSKCMPGTKFIFSELIENIATDEEKRKGLDIADFLLQHDYKDFKGFSDTKQAPLLNKPLESVKNTPYNISDIVELERFFSTYKIPDKIELKHYKINDVKKFINSHLEVVKSNFNNKLFNVYYSRLIELRVQLLSLQ